MIGVRFYMWVLSHNFFLFALSYFFVTRNLNTENVRSALLTNPVKTHVKVILENDYSPSTGEKYIKLR